MRSRYWMTAGIGKIGTGTPNDLGQVRVFPHVVIISPSGNMAQVLPMSGVTNYFPVTCQLIHQRELGFSHKSLAWHKKELFFPAR